ncbi:MAG: serine/threonine protein kinase, partial [Oscillospiraceae bacterium]|nr:serine/threonine protein kinase [Oscillospiraceae bacterium]
MESLERLCMRCMTHGLGADGVCANCGAEEKALWVAPHHLKPRTILNGKYLVGNVIGEGGFGITYVGWDMMLSLKVAVKEYYP